MTTQPLDWIEQIDAHLAQLDEKPQFGTPSPLDWNLLQEELRQLLSQPELTLAHQEKGWITAEEMLSGLGTPSIALAIEWAPLKAPVYFVTSEQTAKEFMGLLFVPEEQAPHFFDPELVKGFYTYFGLEILRLLSKQSFASPLSPRLGTEMGKLNKEIGEGSSFAIDLSLQLNGAHLWGRLLLPEPFRREWKTYFAQKKTKLTEEMRQKIWVELGLEVGHSRLRFQDWQKAKAGDFVILDHCSYDPSQLGGSVVLTLQQLPILRGRLKNGSIKITQYPIYEEVTNMPEKEPKSNGSFQESDNAYKDLNDFEDENFDEESLLEDFDEDEEEEMPQNHPQELSITAEDLPIQLTIEVGRVKMTAAELMHLAPGNLLELNVAPEQGVDLLINGKKVGRGELIRMGDLLGVRILSI